MSLRITQLLKAIDAGRIRSVADAARVLNVVERVVYRDLATAKANGVVIRTRPNKHITNGRRRNGDTSKWSVTKRGPY